MLFVGCSTKEVSSVIAAQRKRERGRGRQRERGRERERQTEREREREREKKSERDLMRVEAEIKKFDKRRINDPKNP